MDAVDDDAAELFTPPDRLPSATIRMRPRTSSLVRLRRQRSARPFFSALLVATCLGVLSWLLFFLWVPEPLTIAFFASLGIVLFAQGFLRDKERRYLEVRGEVDVHDESILFRGKVLARRSQVRRVCIFPEQRGYRLVIQRRWPRSNVELRTHDAFAATEAADALAHDAATSFWGLSTKQVQGPVEVILATAAAALAIFTLLVVSGVTSYTAHMLVGASLVGLSLLSEMRTRIDVTDEAVEVRTLLGRRVIELAHIAGVQTSWDGWGRSRVIGVVLQLKNGELLRVPVARFAAPDDVAAARAALANDCADPRVYGLVKRIQQAIDVSRAVPWVNDPTEAVALLTRGKQTHLQWVRALRAMGTGAAAGWREAFVPHDRLFAIMRDRRVPALARGGAAAAIANVLSPDDPIRRRIQAESALPAKARAALLVASDQASNDDAVAAALAELELLDAPPKSQARTKSVATDGA